MGIARFMVIIEYRLEGFDFVFLFIIGKSFQVAQKEAQKFGVEGGGRGQGEKSLETCQSRHAQTQFLIR